MTTATAQITMSDLLNLVVSEGASDLHLTVGVPPVLRLHGALHPLDADVLRPEDTERLMKSITSDEHLQRVREQGGTDFGFGFGNLARFRVSVFKQKGHIGMVLRLIPSKLMSLEEIGLPAQVKDLLFRPRGMILVTGPTGSGKTTTLASMLNIINEERDCHVITIEDPVEYYHSHKKSVVTQREIGVDVPTFKEALRRGLRQDPDVILVGEMRDLETMEAAITAAETGHLVFATLHTISAAESINRIIDAFPVNQQEQMRAVLSVALKTIISQTLLPRASGRGRVAAYEILHNTPAVANLIREKKTNRIISTIQTSAKQGMITMDDYLLTLYKRGIITGEICLERCHYPSEMREKMMGLIAQAEDQPVA